MRAIRRRTPTDARASYEKVHEKVLERLEGTSEETAYLNALFTFDPNDARARNAYFAAAEPFLNAEERGMLMECVPVVFGNDGCPQCGAHQWELDERRSERVCGCGVVQKCGTVSAKYLPFDRTVRSNYHAYRRITHFTSLLDALTTRRPPPDLLAAVEAEARRQRVDPARLVHARMRDLMRAVGAETSYPLAPTLLAALKREPLPRLTVHEIMRLHALFESVQRAFTAVIRAVDRQRKNFVSYPFLLRKCLQHIGRDDLGAHLFMLKTPEKVRRQQVIWGAIHRHLNW